VVVPPLVVDLGAQRAQRIDVHVDRPSADAIAARVGYDDFAATPEHWPQQHKRSPQALGGLQRNELPIQLPRVDLQLVLADPARIHTQVAQYFEDVFDIRDPWRIGD